MRSVRHFLESVAAHWDLKVSNSQTKIYENFANYFLKTKANNKSFTVLKCPYKGLQKSGNIKAQGVARLQSRHYLKKLYKQTKSMCKALRPSCNRHLTSPQFQHLMHTFRNCLDLREINKNIIIIKNIIIKQTYECINSSTCTSQVGGWRWERSSKRS